MSNAIAFDIEGTGLRRHKSAEMFAFSTCEENGRTDVFDRRNATRRPSYFRELRRLWGPTCEAIPKIGHHMKFDCGFVMKELHLSWSEMRKHTIHETMALAHIFRNDRLSYALDNVAWDLFGYPKNQDDATAKYMSKEWGLLHCPEFVLDPYQRADVERTMLIFLHLYPKLKDHGWEDIYRIEQELVWTTLRLEDRGVMIDRARCCAMIGELEESMADALRIYRTFSGDRSTPQSNGVGPLLEREMDVGIHKRTASGRVAADKDVVLGLREMFPRNPLIESILRYRSHKRGISIIQGYLNEADANDVIHPSIHPYGARTGRESCRNPNLQNVSKSTTLQTPYPIAARSCFRPKPGYVNVHIDYAGIEARLLSHFSEDPELMRIFTDGDGDFHSAIADATYGRRWRDADKAARKSLRDAAKNGDFALGYGAGWSKYAHTVGIDVNTELPDARRRITERYPAYIHMSTRFIREVRANGYVTTPYGRRLYVPRGKGYMGTNYITQGFAAEILKRSQVGIDEYLRRATGDEAGIILPIHDELVVEWPEDRMDELPEHLREMRRIMIDCPHVRVPLEIEVELSRRDWNTLEKYPIEHKRKILRRTRRAPAEAVGQRGARHVRVLRKRNA